MHKTQFADNIFKCFVSMYQAEQVPSQYQDQWWSSLLAYIYVCVCVCVCVWPDPSAFHINFLFITIPNEVHTWRVCPIHIQVKVSTNSLLILYYTIHLI